MAYAPSTSEKLSRQKLGGSGSNVRLLEVLPSKLVEFDGWSRARKILIRDSSCQGFVISAGWVEKK